MGKINNRWSYNFPHAKFIELLKYKAMLKDILVIETEESYTSKTSFIDNENLNSYEDKVLQKTQDTKHQFSGKRINRVFVTKDGVRVHAEINGGFNISRKILNNFCYNKKQISLSYDLTELNLRGKKKFKSFCMPPGQSAIFA